MSVYSNVCQACGDRPPVGLFKEPNFVDSFWLCQDCVDGTTAHDGVLIAVIPTVDEYASWVAAGGPALIQAELAVAVEPVRTLVAKADAGLLTACDFRRLLRQHLRVLDNERND